MNLNTGEPVNPTSPFPTSPSASSFPDLSSLESIVAAAKQKAAAAQTTTPVAETPTVTNSPDVMRPDETSTATSAVPFIKPNSTASTAEISAKPEQANQDKVIQQIKDVLEQYDLKEKKPAEVTA